MSNFAQQQVQTDRDSDWRIGYQRSASQTNMGKNLAPICQLTIRWGQKPPELWILEN